MKVLFIILISLFIFPFAWAAKKNSNSQIKTRVLSCDYNNGLSNFEFTIGNFENQTFKKEFSLKNKSYRIFVNNINEPSEVTDYVEIKKDKYKMTYSLECRFRKYEPLDYVGYYDLNKIQVLQ